MPDSESPPNKAHFIPDPLSNVTTRGWDSLINYRTGRASLLRKGEPLTCLRGDTSGGAAPAHLPAKFIKKKVGNSSSVLRSAGKSPPSSSFLIPTDNLPLSSTFEERRPVYFYSIRACFLECGRTSRGRRGNGRRYPTPLATIVIVASTPGALRLTAGLEDGAISPGLHIPRLS